MCAILSTSVEAEEPNVGIRVTLDEPTQQELLTQEASTDFTMRPSVTSSTIGKGERKLPLIILCVDLNTGAIINYCNIVIEHQAQAYSGGHDHDSSTRPKGTFEPASGSTGTSGLYTTYTSPDVSGIIITKLNGTSPDGSALGGCPRIAKSNLLPQYIVCYYVNKYNIMWSRNHFLSSRTAS